MFYDDHGEEARRWSSTSCFLHLGASVSFIDRLRIAANLPIAALVTGDVRRHRSARRVRLAEGGELGDLRISADVRLFGKYRGL